MFYSTEPHYCPACKPERFLNKRTGKLVTVRQRLLLSEENYSGTGISMANCEKCGRGFAISYKVDKITPEPDWDVDYGG